MRPKVTLYPKKKTAYATTTSIFESYPRRSAAWDTGVTESWSYALIEDIILHHKETTSVSYLCRLRPVDPPGRQLRTQPSKTLGMARRERL